MSRAAYVLIFLSSHLVASQIPQSWNLQGKPGEGYYLDVRIGTPPQRFNVLVDTGSTNFAIAASENPNADTYFMSSNSSSFQPLHQEVSVLYTQGYWKGQLGSDVVWFPQLNSPLVRCDISLIETSDNFYMKDSKWQGILGLAYPVIAQPNRNMVSWLEALHRNSPSNTVAFSLELCGSDTEPETHVGTLQIHGETGNLQPAFTAPVVREWFYEVSLVGISVGNESVDLPCQEFNNDKTIIDSGTTSLRLPNKVFEEVVQLMNATVTSQGLSIPRDFWYLSKMACGEAFMNINIFPNMKLSIAHSGSSYFILELLPQSYMRKVYDTTEIMEAENCYKFAVESSDTGTVLGVVMMEGLVVVFNQTNKTVGFAESTCGPSVKLSGLFETISAIATLLIVIMPNAYRKCVDWTYRKCKNSSREEDVRDENAATCLYCDLTTCLVLLHSSPMIDFKKCSNIPGVGNTSALTITAYVMSSLLGVCGLLLLFSGSQWLWDSYFKRKLHRSVSHESLVAE